MDFSVYKWSKSFMRNKSYIKNGLVINFLKSRDLSKINKKLIIMYCQEQKNCKTYLNVLKIAENCLISGQ